MVALERGFALLILGFLVFLYFLNVSFTTTPGLMNAH